MMSKTKKALSSLDFAIENFVPNERIDDEFTLAEYVVKTKCQRSTAQRALDQLVRKGLLTKRKISIDGSLTNLYSKP